MKSEKLQFKVKSFQNRVYEVVKRIPRGEVMTYKEVGQKVGNPRAWRAVGNILNKNKDLHPPKFSKKTLAGKQIPCHRVIRAGKEIGGYKDGFQKKKILLKKEGVVIRKGKSIS